jgi:hypothetical protein
MTPAPAFRYYSSLVGRWSGPFTFAVTDWRALRREPARTVLRVGAMGALARLVGAATMKTTLHAAGAGFKHTTRVEKGGVAVVETVEIITLLEGGRSFRLAGEQRSPFDPPAPYEASGEVDEDATRATYRIPWQGVTMRQQTAIVEGGLALSQATAWSYGSVVLRRH